MELAAEEVVIFANPCTLQIVSKHWTDEIIKSPAKKVNAPLIEKYTGVKDYKGRESKIDEIMECITLEGYDRFQERIQGMETDDRVLGGTNFGKFLERVEGDSAEWIGEVNRVVEAG